MSCTGVRVVGAFKINGFSSSFRSILTNSQFHSKHLFMYRGFSSALSIENGNEQDPAPLFFNPEVQNLLKTLTRVDLKKVFRRRKEGQALEPPSYKFMTDLELETAMNEAKVKAEQRLQMPPVVKKRNDETKLLAKDSELQGYSEYKFAFTDITYGVSNRERLMVVRQPDGSLRYANADERHRYNQIYFPITKRRVYTPRLFQNEYLESLLDREEYEFILDHACLQFEPDDPEYQRITSTVYSRVNDNKHFDSLRSTRHYGPLAFYLAWNQNIDQLLLENIQTERLDDAVALIQLYHKINLTAKSASVEFDGDELNFVQSFVDADAHAKSMLELAIHSYIDLRNAREEMARGIKEAHGSK